MQELAPFRPWKFRDWDPEKVHELTHAERKQDDRSPFVRYARAAALLSQWTREGEVLLSPEPSCPMVSVGPTAFQLGVVPVASIRTTMSVLPSAKEHLQRTLEGLQLYIDPIPVVRLSTGEFAAIGNHELLAAAKSYQEELARPGKIRSSDYCLVALADESILDTISVQPLGYSSSVDQGTIANQLSEAGYTLSPRTDDPRTIMVQVNGQIFHQIVTEDNHWREELAQLIGVRTLDLNSISEPKAGLNLNDQIVLVTPKLTRDVIEKGFSYPYLSLKASIQPASGAMMWSLRDFRAE